MKRTKRYTALLVAITLSLCAATPAMAAQYVSIAELRKEIKDGWHRTYEVNGNLICVDENLEIPNVDLVPIVEVARVKPLQPHSNEVDVICADADMLVIEKRTAEDAYITGMGKSIVSINLTDHATNSPMNAHEAEEFLKNIFRQYEVQLGTSPIELELSSLLVNSQEYEKVVDEKTGKLTSFDVNKPISKMGYYYVWFYRTYHGIPRLESGMMGNGENIKILKKSPLDEIYGVIASEADFSFVISTGKEVGIIAEDVPLATFALVKQEIERLIHDGYILAVYDISFGYNVNRHPQNPSEVSILTPVWRIRGDIVDRPGLPPAQLTDEDKLISNVSGGRMLCIDAQTGKVRTSIIGNYLTWDQVK